MHSNRLLVLSLLTAATAMGCAAPEPEAPAAPVRVESEGLGLAIADLPDGVEVVENEGEVLRLADGEDGELSFTVAPPAAFGVNLVEEVKARREAFEADGLYYGNRELMTPWGPAYTARGQLTGADGPVEETWVYTIHPGASDRLLSVVYRYPGGGDAQARVGTLLGVLGELEAL